MAAKRGAKAVRAFELASAFVHLDDAGGAQPVPLTPGFWRGDGARYARLVGVVDFRTPEDLHASAQEMHPEADELLYLVAGGIDLVLEESNGERRVELEAGQAAIVPRGVWHRLVVRRPGRLLFVNSRAGMRSRSYPGGD